MRYSRQHPSPRYQELIEKHRKLHAESDFKIKTPLESEFWGLKVYSSRKKIKEMIEKMESKTLLDYGCGKGGLYFHKAFKDDKGKKVTLIEYWGLDSVCCYDPAYAPFRNLPKTAFDAVICVDVLEHCPEEDIPWIVEELFSFANCFVFATIACDPAFKKFLNGENVHSTICPPEWWKREFSRAASQFPNIKWEIDLYKRVSGGWYKADEYGNLQ